jgi:hypothetical protein
MMKWLSRHIECFPKTLFTLSCCRITEDDGFGDLVSRSQVHANNRDEADLVHSKRKMQKSRCVCEIMGWCFFVWWSYIFIEESRLWLRRPIRSLVIILKMYCICSKNKLQKVVMYQQVLGPDFSEPVTCMSCACALDLTLPHPTLPGKVN